MQAKLRPPGATSHAEDDTRGEGLSSLEEPSDGNAEGSRPECAGLQLLEYSVDYRLVSPQRHERTTNAFVIPSDVTSELRRWSHDQGASLSMTLLATWEAVLGRRSGQEEFGLMVCSTPAGAAAGLTDRDQATRAVVRADLKGDPAFTELLTRVRDSILEAEMRPTSSAPMVGAAPPNPSLSVSFAHRDVTSRDENGARPVATSLVMERDQDSCDISLEVEEATSEMRGHVSCAAEVLAPVTTRWIAQHFLAALRAVTQEPNRRVSELPLSEGEWTRLLVEWNETARAYPGPQTLSEALEAQRQRTPHAPALTFADTTMSYADLHARVDQVAMALIVEGVGPGDVVGVFMHRSIEMVVALIAIIKAGAAYLPVDPELPTARVSMILKDADAQWVLTQSALRIRLPDASAARCVDDDAEWSPYSNVQGPLPRNKPSDLAYVIYTSGSTGQPKGVMIEHGALMNRLWWMQDAFPLGVEDRVLQKTPFGFDVSVWEFFWPLITGARLVVAKAGGHRDPDYLLDLVKRQRITTIHFVPSMLEAVVREPRLSECASLRQVFVSGEALSFELMKRFCQRHNAELVNLYGPTEAAIDVSVWRCNAAAANGRVPIGKPIANIELYVLDSAMRPLPVGAVGELYIGGVGLARGYLNRPELTVERFVPHPFRSGARLYRTGDRCRFLSDGNIEYLGRTDNQIKLRGHRIELGEIETALREMKVRETVVVVHDDRLIAYLVGGPPEEDLQRALRRRLPAYMVPSAYVTLGTLPLTSHGKVDRRALPPPECKAQT